MSNLVPILLAIIFLCIAAASVFFATILVCNTKEQAMLKFSSKFFEKYPTVQDVADDVDATWRWMAEYKIQHAKRKVQTLIDAAKLIIQEGEVPNDQRKLESVSGVGHHVSSVTLAWTKQAPEYGVDVHVSRIMKRLGLVPEKTNDKDIEAVVKAQICPEQLGHFSRSFVDYGQNICSYSLDYGGVFYVPFVQWLRTRILSGKSDLLPHLHQQ